MDSLGMIFKLKGMWNTFTRNHPMFPKFLQAVNKKGITEGTIIDVTITSPDGTPLSTNIKITSSDLELFEAIRTMKQ